MLERRNLCAQRHVDLERTRTRSVGRRAVDPGRGLAIDDHLREELTQRHPGSQVATTQRASITLPSSRRPRGPVDLRQDLCHSRTGRENAAGGTETAHQRIGERLHAADRSTHADSTEERERMNPRPLPGWSTGPGGCKVDQCSLVTGCSKRSSVAAVADPVSRAAISPRRLRFFTALRACPQCLRSGRPKLTPRTGRIAPIITSSRSVNSRKARASACEYRAISAAVRA